MVCSVFLLGVGISPTTASHEATPLLMHLSVTGYHVGGHHLPQPGVCCVIRLLLIKPTHRIHALQTDSHSQPARSALRLRKSFENHGCPPPPPGAILHTPFTMIHAFQSCLSLHSPAHNIPTPLLFLNRELANLLERDHMQLW